MKNVINDVREKWEGNKLVIGQGNLKQFLKYENDTEKALPKIIRKCVNMKEM